MIPGTPTVTLEVRWFVGGAMPGAAVAWVHGLGEAACEVEERADLYLRPSSAQAANVKLREGGVEVKQLQSSQREVLRVGEALHLPARLETWAKWRFGSVSVRGDAGRAEEDVASGWVRVEKQRYQRHFTELGQVVTRGDSAARASLEVSAVRTPRREAWSLCIEASGPSHDARKDALCVAASTFATLPLEMRRALAPSNEASYAAWLSSTA